MSGALAAHLQGLNPEQEEAVRCTEGPLLILAGAGSGKTRVLTRRVAELLHQGVAPWRILAVTFTNKAAEEMAHRVRELVGDAAQELWIATFHSACVRMLRRDIEALGYTRDFAIWDDDDQTRVLRQLLKAEGVDEKRLSVRSLRGLIDRAKNRLEGPDDLRDSADVPGVAARLFAQYEEQLRRSNALDFNDIVNRTVELLRKHPAVLRRWQGRFHYLMVDEYQDTNRAQYLLVRLLAGARRNVAVVGDDDQSIYSFRGADIRNILDFEQDFPEARVVRLEQNYRSTASILGAATAVVRNNQQRKDKTLRTDAGGGDRLRLIVAVDEEDEGRRVVAELRALRAQGVRYGDVAIIYRTNARSRVFEQALVAARIPHRLIGARRFYERAEVKDLVAYARLLLNPADTMAFSRVLNAPRRGLGDRTLEQALELAVQQGITPVEAARRMAQAGGRGAKALAAFVALIEGLQAELPPQRTPGELLQLIAERSGYLDELRREGLPESEDRVRNIEELARAAEALPPAPPDDPGATLREFLDRAALAGQDEELGAEGDHVLLMTAHLAKGLEFPVVFVVGLNEGSFPMLREQTAEDEVEEERRLMYVAITRARRRLYLTRAMVRASWKGAPEDARRSRFLDEIPRELCEGGPPRAPQAPRIPLPPGGTERLQRFLSTQPRAPGTPRAPPDSGGSIRVTRPVRSPGDLALGARVLHPRWGEGVIVRKRQLSQGMLLTVDFVQQGRQTFDPGPEELELVIR